MTEGKNINLEPSSVEQIKFYHIQDLCFQTEELINKTSIIANETNLSLAKLNILREKVFNAVHTKINEMNLPESDKRIMYGHLCMSRVARKTMTVSELKTLFNLQSELDDVDQVFVAEHNYCCAIFFVIRYIDMVYSIMGLRENGIYYSVVVEGARWIRDEIIRFQQVRRYFPFCDECEFNKSSECHFWAEMALHLNDIVSIPVTEQNAAAVREYLQGLEIPCKCPQSIEELKKRQGGA